MNLSCIFSSPLGPLKATANGGFIVSLQFLNDLSLRNEQHLTPLSHPLSLLMEELSLYFAQKLFSFSIPIKLKGTLFQETIWENISKIPYGKTLSYERLSENAGYPIACRATALSCKRNPLPIVVPCHRVIRKSTQLGGYNFGCERKQKLLSLEGALDTL